MSYQQGLSQFILHDNANDLHTLFDEDADASIARIYRNGFFRSCHEVLASTFPSVQSFLGEEFFKALVHAFIQIDPPAIGTLTGYGETFPLWITAQDLDKNPLLGELAELDWAWITCLHGSDATPLTAESFQRYLTEGVNTELPEILLIENTHLIASNEKAINIWLSLKEGLTDDDSDLEAANKPQSIVLWRPELDVFARALAMDEALFIEEISYCNNLDAASAKTFDRYPDFNLAEKFSGLLQHGLLTIKRD
ncbi:DNA-binding domain-containing protein [Dasania marina]|uniref:HvfC/BufC N-terminal domain-containing protein n=1 Tax=Dasania marina TaxID=471499 RepID=UPI0030DC3147|tara:strand:- start:80055 stop:80813 length:759 start_codon:yes stop_codon:yes gene_type:complete